jgi:hypothetical protein
VPLDLHDFELSGPGSRPRLDPASAQTLRRFIVMFVIILIWAGMWWNRLPEHGVAAMMGMAAVTTTLVASLFGERFLGPSLNRWDEALAFFAVYCLVRVVS